MEHLTDSVRSIAYVIWTLNRHLCYVKVDFKIDLKKTIFNCLAKVLNMSLRFLNFISSDINYSCFILPNVMV